MTKRPSLARIRTASKMLRYLASHYTQEEAHRSGPLSLLSASGALDWVAGDCEHFEDYLLKLGALIEESGGVVNQSGKKVDVARALATGKEVTR